MMRLASILLVLTLLTTSVISGTFAKYTTTGTAEDAARVAKWGVTVGSSGSLFTYQYATTDTTAPTTISYSVVSSNTNPTNGGSSATGGDEVVAPGTSNTSGITFTLKGTPEVAVKVVVAVTGASSSTSATDIFLKKNATSDSSTGYAYKDYTSGSADATFTLTDDYYPLKFTLKNGANGVLLDGVSLSAVETYLEDMSGSYPANTNLNKIGAKNTSKNVESDGTYTLTWTWAFSENDKADTLLGQLASDSTLEALVTSTTNGDKITTAESVLTKDTDFSTDVNLGVSITVTQID